MCEEETLFFEEVIKMFEEETNIANEGYKVSVNKTISANNQTIKKEPLW